MRVSGRLQPPIPDAHHAAMLKARIIALVAAAALIAVSTTILGSAWSALLAG